MSLLERINSDFRIVRRTPTPSLVDLAKLRLRFGDLGELESFYQEAGSIDVLGPERRHFCIYSTEECLGADLSHKIYEYLPGMVPIGTDGGGLPILMGSDGIYRGDYGALDTSMLTCLSRTLVGFFEDPSPLWRH
jgi:hypothetical protein